uniref:Uncharacterized protein n=1 Tax=Triticum urartu TaxID=4572 RepID=A0A8R7TPT1_TRIUA
MALIKNNTSVMCLVILLMSTTLLPCEATGRNKGTTSLIDVCGKSRLCEDDTAININWCKASCQISGYSFERSYCEKNNCCCAS